MNEQTNCITNLPKTVISSWCCFFNPLKVRRLCCYLRSFFCNSFHSLCMLFFFLIPKHFLRFHHLLLVGIYSIYSLRNSAQDRKTYPTSHLVSISRNKSFPSIRIENIHTRSLVAIWLIGLKFSLWVDKTSCYFRK